MSEVTEFWFEEFLPICCSEVSMTIIRLPPDVEGLLVAEARRKGTTPEQLAVEGLRKIFAPRSTAAESAGAGTLFDFLSGHLGAVSGTTEPLSERCGERFAEGLAEKQQRGRL